MQPRETINNDSDDNSAAVSNSRDKGTVETHSTERDDFNELSIVTNGSSNDVGLA